MRSLACCSYLCRCRRYVPLSTPIPNSLFVWRFNDERINISNTTHKPFCIRNNNFLPCEWFVFVQIHFFIRFFFILIGFFLLSFGCVRVFDKHELTTQNWPIVEICSILQRNKIETVFILLVKIYNWNRWIVATDFFFKHSHNLNLSLGQSFSWMNWFEIACTE